MYRTNRMLNHTRLCSIPMKTATTHWCSVLLLPLGPLKNYKKRHSSSILHKAFSYMVYPTPTLSREPGAELKRSSLLHFPFGTGGLEQGLPACKAGGLSWATTGVVFNLPPNPCPLLLSHKHKDTMLYSLSCLQGSEGNRLHRLIQHSVDTRLWISIPERMEIGIVCPSGHTHLC